MENGSATVFVTPLGADTLAAVRSKYGTGRPQTGVRTPDMRIGALPIDRFVVDNAINVVVMPAHGRNVIVRAVRGTIDDHVVRQTPVPVIVIHPLQPCEHQHEDLQHVAIPLDGTPGSERAIEAVAAIDPDCRLRYTLLQIVRGPVADTFGAVVGAQINDIEASHGRAHAQDYLESVADRLRARGAQVDPRVVVQDDTGRALLDEIDRLDVDLIAMTTHSRTGWWHHDIGSIAAKVLRHTSVPVMLFNTTAAVPDAVGAST